MKKPVYVAFVFLACAWGDCASSLEQNELALRRELDGARAGRIEVGSPVQGRSARRDKALPAAVAAGIFAGRFLPSRVPSLWMPRVLRFGGGVAAGGAALGVPVYYLMKNLKGDGMGAFMAGAEFGGGGTLSAALGIGLHGILSRRIHYLPSASLSILNAGAASAAFYAVYDRHIIQERSDGGDLAALCGIVGAMGMISATVGLGTWSLLGRLLIRR